MFKISSDENFPITCPSFSSLASKENIFSEAVPGITTILAPTTTGVTEDTSCKERWRWLPLIVSSPLHLFPFGTRYSVLLIDSIKFLTSVAFQENENTLSSWSDQVGLLLLKYNRPRSLRTSPSWRTAWVEAAWKTCSCSFFLLKMALQPLTLHCTALSWHWLRCSITWHRGRSIPQLSGHGILLCEHKESTWSAMKSLATPFPHSRQGISCFWHWPKWMAISSRGIVSPHPAFSHVSGSFPHMLEWCSWSSYFPTHSQPVLVHWMSSLAVIPLSTILTFSAVPREIISLQIGQSGSVAVATSFARQSWQPEWPHARVTGFSMVDRLSPLCSTQGRRLPWLLLSTGPCCLQTSHPDVIPLLWHCVSPWLCWGSLFPLIMSIPFHGHSGGVF